jgi:hypothetical protein
MVDSEIYKNWPYRTRYLRPECWAVLSRLIKVHQITSVLEFGSGISTLLFNNRGIDVVSYETSPTYLKVIKSYNLANVEFRLWDNQITNIEGEFGLSLVDGALPRTRQLFYALKHSRYIAVDDFTDPLSNVGLQPLISNCQLIAGYNTKLKVFRRKN